MLSTRPSGRLRTTALLLGLLLMLGAFVPAAGLAANPPAGALGQDGSSSQTATILALQPLQEAYDLLLDRYALPLSPSELVAAGQTAMEEALKEAGVESVAPGLVVVGNDRLQQFAGLRQRFLALAGRYGSVLPPNELAYAAIEGMTTVTNDTHVNFMTPEQYQEHVRWTRGDVSYAGIGARMRGPQATVLEVFRDSPAERAGLRAGDTIVGVDGRPVGELRLDEVINLVRGQEGTTVVLDVQRAISGQVDKLDIVRARVSMPFVDSRRLADDIGYIHLRGFPEPSVIEAVEQAVLQHQRDGVRALVFDLRGNGGGRLDVGTRLLARFVPEGPIYQSVDRRGRHEVVHVRDANPILSVPLAVLIDEGTASMGEIFAAAVQENRVGRVLGATSAGSVAASIVLPLSDGSALQLSVELVYSGGGALLDREGVHPDEEITLDLADLRLGHDAQLERAIGYLREQIAQQPPAPAAPVAVGAR
jgi:carboxyl-terminal processing protease